MTKDQKQQLYLLVSDLQSNLVRLHASGTTGTIMDESLDILNKMMGYFIISGTEQDYNEQLDEQEAIEEQETNIMTTLDKRNRRRK